MELFSIAIGAMLVSNAVLENFLGICPFLGVSKKRNQAFGMGIAITFVIVFSTLITYLIYYTLLIPLNLEYLKIISFILIIASLVQFTEMLIKKYFPSLYESFGIYLPLITTNCMVLGTVLNSIILSSESNYNLIQVLFYSIFTSLGYLLVIFLFSSIREKLDSYPIPKPFKGIPIALIIAAFMAMAFKGFVGLI